MLKVTATAVLMDGSVNVSIMASGKTTTANIDQGDWFATVKNWQQNHAELIDKTGECGFDLPEIAIDPSFDSEQWPNALQQAMKALSFGYIPEDYMNIDPSAVESWMLDMEVE